MIDRITNHKLLKDRPTESITAAAFIVAMAGIASRVLGLFRDRILASHFGAGDIMDSYYAAFRIPDMLYNFLILGALSAAFIPVFTGLMANDKKEEGWRLASGILSLLIATMMILAVILAIFAPFIMHLITPGFSSDKIQMTALFSRIMFLSPLLLGSSAIFGGILVSFKKFIIYSLAPMMYNVGIILGALFFVPVMGPVGLAWGVVLGALMHLMIQYPAVRFSGFSFTPMFRRAWRDVYTKKVFYLMLPRTFAIAANQINLLIITIFASTLKSGSLSVFNFANNLQGVPMGVIGVSFAVAAFPTLSSFSSRSEHKDFVFTFSKTLQQIIFFIIPLSAFMIILRAQIVRIILGAGQFDWEDTVLTFNTMGILAISLFAQSIVPLLTRSFYALHNTKTPFYIALGSEFINFILVILLIKYYTVEGLAVAFSAASIFNMAVLFLVLRKKFEGLDEKNLFRATLKVMLATGVALIFIQIAKVLISYAVDIDRAAGILLQLVISGGLGALVFLLMSHWLKIEEFQYFKDSFIKRIFRAKNQITETTDEISGV